MSSMKCELSSWYDFIQSTLKISLPYTVPCDNQRWTVCNIKEINVWPQDRHGTLHPPQDWLNLKDLPTSLKLLEQIKKVAATKARNWLKSKPNKWGVKLFVLADWGDGFTSDFSIYWYKSTFPAGTGPDGQNNFADIASICSVIIFTPRANGAWTTWQKPQLDSQTFT